ncbi:MAG TPA: alkaline phosphatase family protein [Actinomycetes bacterium]|jgi:phospholipase C|nr:alkaline phosphatase family protein [Actinomycetes bacterium]
MLRRLLVASLLVLVALAVIPAGGAAAASGDGADRLSRIQHLVVIYQENHSFDNLYGSWPGVNGLDHARPARTVQVNQAGTPYECLLQNDVNLTSPPLSVRCTDATTGTAFTSHFTNRPFTIDDSIPASATTCPPPGVFAANGIPNGTGLPGGCTRDLVHRFYQEQYQLNGGRQNRYVTGSDAVGLAMGVYDTHALPVYTYLHRPGHPHYAIADTFFQAAFGGSYLNHQWLIAARNPVWPGALNDGSADDLHSVADANGMPTSYPLYASPAGTTVRDAALTASCNPAPGRGPTPPGVLCGDYAVNTIQPAYQPYAPGTAVSRRLPPQTAPTIGDRLSGAGVDWAWYSGGWSNANGDVGGPGWSNGTGPACADPNAVATAVFPNCPDKLFQFHHQAFNYYQTYATGTAARAAHLRDEQEFRQLARSSTDTACNLKPVSFVKPIGAHNEHPGYTSESAGSSHLVDLLKEIQGSRCANDTMVVVTYDEFGGQWDHVPPPGQGGAPGPHDVFGPGTRLPALVISPFLRGDVVVDHTQHDTTSILATIEHRFGLAPLSARDAAVHDLSSVFHASKPVPRR